MMGIKTDWCDLAILFFYGRNIKMFKLFWRYCAALAATSFGVLLYISPQLARASYDFSSTQEYAATGPFARTSEVCAKDKIQEPLLLPDVVELALCNNPQTRSLWAASRVQAAQLGTSLSAYLPTLAGPISVSGSTSSAGPTTTTKGVSLTVSYLLYDFGGREAGVESAKQLLIAANATRDETLQTTFLTAVQAYYTLLAARASVESFKAAEVFAQASLDAAVARYNAGSSTPADRLQAQTALSQARLNRVRAEGDAASAQGTLANVMGYEAMQPFVLAPVSEATPDPVVEQGVPTSAEVLRAIAAYDYIHFSPTLEGVTRHEIRDDVEYAYANIVAVPREKSAEFASGYFQ